MKRVAWVHQIVSSFCFVFEGKKERKKERKKELFNDGIERSEGHRGIKSALMQRLIETLQGGVVCVSRVERFYPVSVGRMRKSDERL